MLSNIHHLVHNEQDLIDYVIKMIDEMRDNICAGGTAEAAAHERQIVGPYLDTLMDEIAELRLPAFDVAYLTTRAQRAS